MTRIALALLLYHTLRIAAARTALAQNHRRATSRVARR